MNNLYQKLPHQELLGVTLDTIMDKALHFTGADFIQLSFDLIVGKGFTENIYKASTTAVIIDSALSDTGSLVVEPVDQPVVYSISSVRDSQKQLRINLHPFEQLIYIPINEGPNQIILTLGFLHETENAAEIINDFLIGNEYIQLAISQYKLEQLTKEKKFLLAFTSVLNNIKNRGQLFRAINYHLKNYLNFSYATLFVLNNEQDAVCDYFYGLEAEEVDNPFYSKIRIIKYPVDDRVTETSFKERLSAAFDFDEISETHDIQPYLNPNKAKLDTTGLVANLYQGDIVIGHLVVAFEDNVIYKYSSVKVIASLLSSILLKLRAEEISAEREAESEVMQSLNIDFAAIRDKDDLFKIIHYKLKKLFEFGHHWVTVINDDQLSMTSFLQDPACQAKDHPKYRQMTNAKYTTNDRVFNKVLLSKDPHVFNLDQLSARGNMPEYMTILYESGIKKVAMIGLQVGSRIIGVWAICLIADQDMSKKQLNLIKSISNQLSIAVDNIIANMSVRQKQVERELLFSFSLAMTSIRSRSDLLKVIKNDLKKVVQFQDMVIVVAKEGDSDCGIFSMTMNMPLTVESDNKQFVMNAYFNRIIESPGTFVFTEEKIDGGCDNEVICIGLKENNYNIGIFYLTNDIDKQNYTDQELGLIKGISLRISPAVANILANEDIERREKEKELLLALNIDIAAVRHTAELLQVITRRLKDFMEFSHMLITKIDDNRLTSSAFLIDENTPNVNDSAYQQLFKATYPINDHIFSEVLRSSKPKVFDLLHIESEGMLPDYLKPDVENGSTQMVIIRLSKGIEVYGCWFLFFDKNITVTAGKLELLESMANQISISVANIIANEEITRREQEKARLLSFSNTIASVRDKNVLAKLLKKQLNELFNITDYIIHSLSEDKQKYTPILFDQDADFAQLPDFKKLVNAQNNINDGIFNKILASEDPSLFNIDECFNQPGRPDYLISAKEIKLQYMIGTPIRLGQENIAVMTFTHSNYGQIISQLHLFKSILSQIALTVSNIMANERVNRQLEEINNYKLQLEEEKVYLKEEIETTLNYAEIVGESPMMQKIFRLVAQVAPSDSTVLILGETGTGKELIARAIHNNSPRKNKLMVKVNCAALPANLIESELFGHERGSFTGATDRRLGKFELANNGTLFLDEIGEMPLDLQVKLLRALQEKEIERVGGNATIKVNVRIIAATNRDLEKEMLEGRFRRDLYYRLNIFPIELPPLRSRRDDIPLLALYFIQRFAKKAGKDIQTLNNKALQELVQYKWPGNIRELEHLIERSVLLAQGNTIKQVHLPAQQEQNVMVEEAEFVIKTIDDNEKEFILKTLKYCSGRIGGNGGAAMLLGVPTSTLNSKMKRLGIRKEHIT